MNPLDTADPDDHMATVEISSSADGIVLVQNTIDRGTTVNKPDILTMTAPLKKAC